MGGRGTNASMTYYVAEHVMVNPLQMKDNLGERRGRERDSRSGGNTWPDGGVSGRECVSAQRTI